jgi:hypothetical protein
MLSTRSHLEMETLENQLATDALEWPLALEEVEVGPWVAPEEGRKTLSVWSTGT